MKQVRRLQAWLLVFTMVALMGFVQMPEQILAKTNRTITLRIGNQKVTKKTYQMNQGEKKKLKVSVSPKKGKKSIKYVTSNKRIATVNKSGRITAKRAGTARIRVTVKFGTKKKAPKKTTWVRIKVVNQTGSGQAGNTSEAVPSVSSAPSVTNPTPSPVVPTTPAVNPSEPEEPSESKEPGTEGKKSLVVYFSCTDNTKRIAEYVADSAGADIYRIEAAIPYTAQDLNYNDSECRANDENANDLARPGIAGALPNVSEYDNVYIGYPIWWGKAPKIMYTFVENVNLSGKTIIPFCTSGSSGISSSATILRDLKQGNGTWLAGNRFSGSAQKSAVESWVLGLGI